MKKILSMLMLVVFALTLFTGCGEKGGEAKEDKVYEFNVSFAAPEMATTALTAVFERMEEQSEGRLKFNIFYSWSLTSIDSVVKDLQSGVADIAAVAPHEYLNLFPRNTMVTGTPFLGQPGMVEAGEIYTELLEEYPSLMQEYEELGLHYWTYYYNPPYNLFSTEETSAITPDDFKGRKVITSESMMQQLIADNNGAPVTSAITDYYSNLEKGVADGALSHLNALNAFGCGELLNSATVFGEGGMYMKTMVFLFNGDKWDELPDDLKAIIDGEAANLAAESAVEELSKTQAGMAAFAEKGTVHELTEEEVEVWKTEFAPILEEYLVQLESEGVEDARELYEAVEEKVASYK